MCQLDMNNLMIGISSIGIGSTAVSTVCLYFIYFSIQKKHYTSTSIKKYHSKLGVEHSNIVTTHDVLVFVQFVVTLSFWVQAVYVNMAK